MTLDRPYALVMGGGALLFTIVASVASLWARFPQRGARPEESVLAELDAAIRRARIGARWGLATFWVVAAGLVYFAVIAFLWAGSAELPPDAARRFLIVFAIWSVWMAACQTFGILYYLRRAKELARLEEIKRSLAG